MRYPVPLSEFIPWSTAHAERWASDPSAVGMTQQQADSVKAAADAAKAAKAAALAARQASLNATYAQEQAERNLRRAVQTAVMLIDVCAENNDNPAAIYSAAELDAPTVPRAVPAPGKVKQLTASLDPLSGAPVLRWKGNNPRGSGSVTYMVSRRIGGQRSYTFIGTAASSGPSRRTFIDTTLPVGTTEVTYLVRPLRGASEGEPEQVFIRFGAVAGSAAAAERAQHAA